MIVHGTAKVTLLLLSGNIEGAHAGKQWLQAGTVVIWCFGYVKDGGDKSTSRRFP